MRTNFNVLLSYLAIAGSAIAFSCKDDEQSPLQNASDIKEEAVTDFYFQDIDDLGSVALAGASDVEFSGGRVDVADIDVTDYRLCESVVITIQAGETSTQEQPNGILTVDFGTTGCTDIKGNLRKGKVIYTYTGRRFEPNATVVTTFENFSINNIELQGTRTSTNVTASTSEAPSFHVVLENGKAIFPDQTFALRESNIYWRWERGANPLSDKLIVLVGSAAAGTTQGGTTYDVIVTDQLEYQRSCPIAVTGSKLYILDGDREFLVDYGDGDCDRVITVSTGNITRSITL